MISNYCFDYWTHVVYCIIFGVTFGGEVGMTAIVLIDVVGPSKFVRGWGIQVFAMGIGHLTGPPIIGNKFI